MSDITFHASAVFTVRDGYTGEALNPGRLVCALDGRPCLPVKKRDGYLVLIDLEPGPHTLTLRSRGYRDEPVEFTAGEGTAELDVTMKPGAGYPFRQAVTRLNVRVLEKGVPAAGRQIWLAGTGSPEIKLAQPRTEAGASEVRLFCKYPDAVRAPAAYLLEDGERSEIATLRSLDGETGRFSSPLANPHGRGRLLLPAQRYYTGEDGGFSAVFRGTCTAVVFEARRGVVGRIELAEGENALDIELDG